MADAVVCKFRFEITAGLGARYDMARNAGEMRQRSPLHCVYLTRSIRAAVELQSAAMQLSIRVHRAADMKEAQILLRITGAHVILIDLPATREELSTVLHSLDCSCPQEAVVVVASEVDAARWEDVMQFGGFDMVLRPFSRQEVAVVVDAADRYAGEQLTPAAKARRLAALHSLVSDLCAETRVPSGS